MMEAGNWRYLLERKGRALAGHERWKDRRACGGIFVAGGTTSRRSAALSALRAIATLETGYLTFAIVLSQNLRLPLSVAPSWCCLFSRCSTAVDMLLDYQSAARTPPRAQSLTESAFTPSISILIPLAWWTSSNAFSASLKLTVPVMHSLTLIRPDDTIATAVA